MTRQYGTGMSPICAICEHDLADHFHIDPERRVGECTRSCGCECYQSKFTRDILGPAARSVAELVGDVEVEPGQAERIFEEASTWAAEGYLAGYWVRRNK